MRLNRRCVLVLLLTGGIFSPEAYSQVTTSYEDGADGIRYQVTRQIVQTQVPVTEYRDQAQTTYRQQISTQNVPHQQVYNVPITQYQIVSELHGRWNPFVTPYWTHRYEPVTVWQQQVATVQIPVSHVAWVPETRTVQQPVTTWKLANRESVVKTPIGAVPSGGRSNTAIAAARPLTSATPSAQLTPSNGATAMTASRPLGGQALSSDPPRQPDTGWQTSPAATSGTRY
jgi:hypothetical protein